MLSPIKPQKGEFIRKHDLRDTSNPEVLYARSYLLMRAVVGAIGVALPVALWTMEALFSRTLEFRGSISAYYHSPGREVFVGFMSVVAFLLVMYMAGQKDRRREFILSTVAGLALLGVIIFPTQRPGLTDDSPLCGSEPQPNGCSNLQQLLGETTTATIHFLCAAAFILSLAAICFFWAQRYLGEEIAKAERAHTPEPSENELRRQPRYWVPVACGIAILAAVAWVATGIQIGPFTALYVGEVGAILAFAAAWTFASWDLWKLLFRAKTQPAPEVEPGSGDGDVSTARA